MADDLRQRAERLFQEAVDVPPGDRESFLDGRCGDDRPLRESVEHLLAALDGMGDFMRGLPEELREKALDESPPHPTRIGQYAVVRVLGTGGMGIVYEALQESPRREVALKVLHPHLTSPEVLRRFEREAEVLGHLHHPGIATIYEAGAAEVALPGRPPMRQPFLAMELVDGLPLTEYVRRNEPDTRARLELAARICDAVQHAHDRGVVHRDLKPGNILVQADRRPKVLDFGIARATGDDWQTLTVGTASHHLMGTIPYMSPEQVGADPDEVNCRTDVYALGVILFELLSGRLPIDAHARSLPDAVRAIRDDEPTGLGSLSSAWRGDVDAIVGKALRKEKDRRYASAGEMAADIRRHLRSEPIVARPTGTFYQLGKFARRNKALVGGVAATIVALALGLVATTVLARREMRARRGAEAAAEAAAREAHRARMTAAISSLAALDSGAARSSLDEVPEPFRGWEWRHLRWRAAPYLLEIAPPESGERSMVATATETPLLFLANRDWNGCSDGVVRIWNLDAAHETGTLSMDVPCLVRFVSNPEGTLLLADVSSGATDANDPAMRGIAMWDVPARRELWRRPGRFSLGSFAPDGSVVAVGPWSGHRAVLLDVLTGELRREIDVPDETAHTPGFSPDGRRLVYQNAGISGVVDLDTGEVARPGLEAGATFMDGRTLLGSDGASAVLLDLETGARRDAPWIDVFREIHNNDIWARVEPVTDLSSKRLLTSGNSGTVVRRLGDGATVAFLGTREYPLAWTHDRGRVLTLADDSAVHVWDAATDARPLVIPAAHRRGNIAFAMSPDGRHYATAGWRFVTLYDLATGGERWNAYALEPWTQALAFDPEGRTLAVVGPRGSSGIRFDGIRVVGDSDRESVVTLLDLATGETRRVLPGPAGSISGAAWTPDGRRLVLATREGTLVEMRADASGHENPQGLGRPGESYTCLALDANGKHVAVGGLFSTESESTDATSHLSGVGVWDLSSGRRTALLEVGEGTVDAVAFDPSGSRLAATTSTGETVVWDVAGGERIAGETASDVPLRAVAFSPDGLRAVAGGEDGVLRFLDPRGLLGDVVLESGLDAVRSLSFAPDGSVLVAAGTKALVLLETTAPSGGFAARAAEREARSLAHELYEELEFAGEVAARVRADDALPESVRGAALELVRARGDHLGWMSSDAVTAYQTTALPRSERLRALRKIELVHRLRPNDAEHVATLAKCQYRAGIYLEGLDNLARAREIHGAAGRDQPLEDLAFEAMSLWRLEQRDRARRALRDVEARLRRATDVPLRVLGVIREARSVVGHLPTPAEER